MTSPRRLAAPIVGVVGVVVLVVVGGWWLASRSEREAGPPTAQASTRRAALGDLRDRLVPSSAGGWVAASPAAEPSLEGWLLAASQAPSEDGSFDRALRQADQQLQADPNGRSLSLVLAQVLPGPTKDQVTADRLAAEVLDRAIAGLAAGDAGWLAPILQLSAGESPSASGAQRELTARAGPFACDRLRRPGEALPAPQGSLTVAVRGLAASGVRCEQARDLLAEALQSPEWETWVAAFELADLAVLSGELPESTRVALAARFDAFLEVGPEEPIDLGAVVSVQSARRRLGLDAKVSEVLEHHLAGQVASRGALPGRATTEPTALDVAVLRQLVGAGMVPGKMLEETAAARVSPSEAGPDGEVVDGLLAGRDVLRCGDAPGSTPDRGRVTFDGVIADQTWAMVRASCGGRLDVTDAVAQIRASASPDQQVLRIGVALMAACRLDPESLADVPGMRLRATGPFATDSMVIWGQAVAADPTAACAAVTDD